MLAERKCCQNLNFANSKCRQTAYVTKRKCCAIANVDKTQILPKSKFQQYANVAKIQI